MAFVRNKVFKPRVAAEVYKIIYINHNSAKRQ